MTSSEEHSSSPSKRQRTQHHPWQRRKVTIPDDHSTDAYIPADHFWQDLIAPLPHMYLRRPWPSSQVLASSITSGGSRKSPFLQAFYESIGIEAPNHESLDNDTQKVSTEVIDASDMEDLDNSTFSTLTPSQHRRYLKLVQQTERRTPSEKMHWKQLRAVIPAEQAKYRQTVKQFWMTHKDDRLLLGLQPSSRIHTYCHWACGEHRRHNERMLSILKYGKCRQVLSLRSAAVSDQTLLDVATLDFKLVAKSDIETAPIVSLMPTVGTRVACPRQSLVELPLSNDVKALELADQHGAEVMTTDRTLEALLQIPGDFTTQWILPVTRNKNQILIMEAPYAQVYANPRECLTRGIQEGLYQLMASHDESDTDERRYHYIYSVWTLPLTTTTTSTTLIRRSKAMRVLIRSTVRLLESTITPLHIRAHVDFFPERGQELVSRYERSLWILDQLLGNVSKLCRVDGRNGHILEWQDTSVAHAFAAEDDDPMQGFAQLVQFFHAVSTIDFSGDMVGETLPSRLLCLPSRENSSSPSQVPGNNQTFHAVDPYSVSVHAPSNQEVVVDLELLLENADGVSMNAKALEECYRPWRWDLLDRIPYTFPASEKTGTNSNSNNNTKDKSSKK